MLYLQPLTTIQDFEFRIQDWNLKIEICFLQRKL